MIFLCKNYILNALSDDLYDYYSSFKTAKDFWDALQKKYDIEEAGSKKYAVSRYMKFQMVEENRLSHNLMNSKKLLMKFYLKVCRLMSNFMLLC